jgi:putative acetyltransferase
MRLWLASSIVALFSLTMWACGPRIDEFSPASTDRTVSGTSRFPVATDPSRVGKYPGHVKSGAGYFFDEVLEYRVWLHPERGAKPLAGTKDYFAAFAEYERAAAFAKAASGSEQPLVLIRQREWINEPTPGQYAVERGERITEWKVEWLEGSRRGPNSTREFLANPRPAREGASLTTDSSGRRTQSAPIRERGAAAAQPAR